MLGRIAELITRAKTTQATGMHRVTFKGTRSTPNAAKTERRGITLAGADEEVSVRSDGAVEEVHHGPRVAVAHERDRHLLLHRFDSAPLAFPPPRRGPWPLEPALRRRCTALPNAALPARALTLPPIEESEDKNEPRGSARSGSVGLDLYRY
jgi:hypothetical protein